ncbi:MAG TPA: PspC domain-containing protein [Clostridiales bacterium]|jgi:phage shock protein PspC (stress-responsive transcriptional regulator)|nr:PspC domain-containing protein [Clostridiales bacterium]
MGKRLYRSDENKVLGGVCGGIGEYFAVDPVMIRLLWVILTMMGGAGILAYIIAVLVIPKSPAVNLNSTTYSYSSETANRSAAGAETDGRASDPADGEAVRPQPYGPEQPNTARRTRASVLVFGVILIIMGLIVLFKGYLPGLDFRTMGAGILILLGIYLVVMRAKD